MKRTFLLAFICIGLLLCAVGYSDSRYRTSLGKIAPALSLENGGDRLVLDSLRGEYVLLNFWNSTDAASREAANRYTAWMRSHPRADVEFLSVNFDQSPELFSEIVRLDSLEPSQQFHPDSRTAKAIADNYGLKDGYGSLLIDPAGHIVAHNPTDSELSEILR